jgi:hypothetical protein
VLHCTAYGCTNSTLNFDPADKFNEAGNVRPRVIGGFYDGAGKASGVVLWDCHEPLLLGVTARRGVTTNLQIARSEYPKCTTPVGGGLIEACLAENSVGSNAGRYGVGAGQDGVRVAACSIVGNEDLGVVIAPGDGGRVSVQDCEFRAGKTNVQQYAIAVRGKDVSLRAHGNSHDGPRDRFIANAEALRGPGSLLSDNAGFNPVGLLDEPELPASATPVVNQHPYAVEVYVHSGEIVSIEKRDVSGRAAKVADGPNGCVRLEPGEAVAVSYTKRPEWSWFGV